MLFKNIDASLLRFVSTFANNHTGMEVVSFDDNTEETSLPQVDVVGLAGVTYQAAGKMCAVDLMVAVSTRDDTNLFRMRDYLDELFTMLLPEKHIQLYNADTGKEIGNLVVADGTRILPIGGSTTRPLRYISATLFSTITLG